MKLDEILRVTSLTNDEASVKLSPAQINGAENLGVMAHNFSVFRVDAEGLIIFLLKDLKDKIIGQFAFQPAEICGIVGYISRRAYIVPSESNKGYGSDFYMFARKYLKSVIFSDEKQTPSSIALWASLSKRFDVKVLNTRTGKVDSKKDAQKIYTNDPDNSADYLLMLEAPKESVFPEQKIKVFSILTPHALFEEGDY